MKKFIHKINYLKEWFALLGVLGQLGVITVIGFLIVLVSGLFVGSIENSYVIFVDPSSLPLMQDNISVLLFSFLLTIIGLVVTGFVISILSSSLENTFRDIRKGRLKYLGENHTLIINYNYKIMRILQELNLLYEDQKDLHDVIILIDNDEDIEKLQEEIESQHFADLHIFVRFGDTLSIERYKELSICSVHSIIILSNDDVEDEFVRDNNNLRVMNLLFSYEEFATYLKSKKLRYLPVKAIVEFTDVSYFDNIVNKATESLFLALAPKQVLSSILNLSMINLDFYLTWSQLLSFEGHEIYFIDPNKHNLLNLNYRDILLRHKQGLLIGVSRVDKSGNFQLLLNKHDETIIEKDWLIFIARDVNEISFLDEKLSYKSKLNIEQPSEIFVRNVAIIGKKRVIDTNQLLDIDKSNILHLDYSNEELFDEYSYKKLLIPSDKKLISYDFIIINLDDELIYRIALNLRVLFSEELLRKFVFLVDDALIAEHLETAGFKNTILSHLLISKYIAQVSNQLTLHKVFNILFVQEGPEINFLDLDSLPSNLDELKSELIYNNIVYLGVITKDEEVIFEAKTLQNAKSIIVLSNGEM